MRRPSRYFGCKAVTVGPSIVRKHLVEDGTCLEVLNAAQSRLSNEKPIAEGEGLSRADPFGLNNINIRYSLNKKQRWLIPRILEEDIEQLQDPEARLRVSGSVHRQDFCSPLTSKSGIAKNDENAPVISFFTVDESGQTIRKTSIAGASLRTLTEAPKPSRKELRKAKRAGIVQEQGALKALEEAAQSIHFRYSVLDFSHASPSLYNSKKTSKQQTGSKMCRNRDRQIDALEVENLDDLSDSEVYDDWSRPSEVLQAAQQLSDFVVFPQTSLPAGKRERTRKIRSMGDEVVVPKSIITTLPSFKEPIVV